MELRSSLFLRILHKTGNRARFCFFNNYTWTVYLGFNLDTFEDREDKQKGFWQREWVKKSYKVQKKSFPLWFQTNWQLLCVLWTLDLWGRLWQNQSATDFHKVVALVAIAWVLLAETLVFDCISDESLATERCGEFSAVNVSVPDVVFLSSHILHQR